VILVLQETLVQPEQQAQPVPKEYKVTQEPQVRLVKLVQQETLVLKVTREIPELLENKVFKVYKVIQVRLVKLVQLVLTVKTE
jgi:hypothetical protein